MYLTEHFASFIAHTNYENLPQDVIVQAKERIMDTVGAAIAGCCNWEYAQSFRQAIAALGTGHCSVLGGNAIYSPAHAAMINATFAHAVELDDGHKNAGCHAGAVVVPTALVLGQEFKRSGREILVAVVLGYEVVYRIASHMNPKQINKGFHPSSNCDVFGAMAVAGKLMGLNEKQLANGLGQAGMLASGTMEATCSGQRSKCVQVGNAAYSGIMAAFLAAQNMEGCLSALEGKDGLFHTQSEQVDADDVIRDLGVVYSIANTYNKMYPSCRHAQPGIEAVLDLAQEHQITPEQVEHIWIGTHQVAYDLTGIIKAPQNSGQAKFSLAYGSAVALMDHCFGVGHLTAPSYTNPDYLALTERVTCAVDPSVQSKFPQQRGAKVEIILKDGRTYEKELYDLKGSPNNPVGWAELEAKFLANAAAMLSADRSKSLVQQFRCLDQQDDMAALTQLLP